MSGDGLPQKAHCNHAHDDVTRNHLAARVPQCGISKSTMPLLCQVCKIKCWTFCDRSLYRKGKSDGLVSVMVMVPEDGYHTTLDCHYYAQCRQSILSALKNAEKLCSRKDDLFLSSAIV